MSDSGCERVRDLLPLWVRQELADADRRLVEDHVAGCENCRAEARFVRALYAGAPGLPADLEERVRLSVADTPLRRRVWVSPRLAAAAIVVLALGTALIWSRPIGEDNGLLAEEPLALMWPSDDGFIAGVAMLDDLSDDALAELLEELGG